ncbi:MAG: hypothetical protein H0W33_03620 [Gammaproteobacteria bacterium]|nr:hypothetical protein [Gammaproteobacteria bacterium]
MSYIYERRQTIRAPGQPAPRVAARNEREAHWLLRDPRSRAVGAEALSNQLGRA